MRNYKSFNNLKQIQFFGIILIFCIVPLICIGLFPDQFNKEYPIESFVVFHNITEIFSLIVSFSIFGVGYSSYPQSRNAQTYFLSIGFLVIGLIDFMHTMGYKGMPDFVTPNTGNKSTQFWLIARFITALVFIVAIFIKPNKAYSVRRGNLYIFFALLFVGSVYFLVIYNSHLFPDTYIHGVGLTPFKKKAELVIMCMLIVAIVLYSISRSLHSDKQKQYFLAAFIICFFCELVFAVYTSVFDIFNVLGHIFKVVAFQFIYNAVFVSAINEPYEKLVHSNMLLSMEIQENKEFAKVIQKSLKEKENLIGEIFHRTKNSIELVRSLLMIQSSGFPNDQNIRKIVENTSLKIQTMSLVHDHLYQNKDLSEIQVSDYLLSLTKLVKTMYSNLGNGVDIQLDANQGVLLLDTAVPLGLIFTELLSNSLKYAFKDMENGKISIKFKIEGDRSHFDYKDNGVGLPASFDTNDQKKLGLSLLKIIAEKQMGGTLSIDGTQGFSLQFDFPNNLYKRRV
ncbi:MASE3 domain-containing protein [Leptospira bouyouniensis]|uniref:histidine kinase n=1 Tax=Leptospira bouyouniensis TaxID=2484911 RepID=A0ABY2LDQ2_9LEPT|nr:MASE3 domain-containing protein [Leptospira bouyouniensis]TGK54208.1 histidine kinase [Leptospira bouyouniensis]